MNEADYVTWWQGQVCESINAESARLSPAGWIDHFLYRLERYGLVDGLIDRHAKQELCRLSNQLR